MGSGGADVPDYYAVLGVSQEAGEAEIRAAFRRLARENHPDVNPRADAAERFRAVVAAYEVLSDPATRGAYDARRRVAAAGQAGRAGRAGRAPAPGAGGTGRAPAGPWGAPSGGAVPPSRPPVRGLDRYTTLRVPAAVLEMGGTATVEHRRWEHCPRCAGFGRLSEAVPCPVCDGTGFHNGRLSDPCRACWASGTTTVCPDCAGKGGLWRSRRLEVTVPPGRRYGQQLRLRGMGDAGPRGGAPGDLYLELAPPLPAAVQAVASSELVQAALRRLEEWLDRFAPYPAG
jgi:molecular chaperone DnaJ